MAQLDARVILPTTGLDLAIRGLEIASKNVQALTDEFREFSKLSFKHATEALEKSRLARSVEELVAIKVSFLKAVFDNFAQRSRRVGEIAANLPLEFVNTCNEALEATIEPAVLPIEAPAENILPQEVADETVDHVPPVMDEIAVSAALAEDVSAESVSLQATLEEIVDNAVLEAEALTDSIPSPEPSEENIAEAVQAADEPAEDISPGKVSKKAIATADRVTEEPQQSKPPRGQQRKSRRSQERRRA
jgi:hypothetical protein